MRENSHQGWFIFPSLLANPSLPRLYPSDTVNSRTDKENTFREQLSLSHEKENTEYNRIKCLSKASVMHTHIKISPMPERQRK